MKRPKITPIAASPWTDLLPHGISDHDKLIHQAFLQARGLGDRHGFGERCREVLKEEAYASISLEDVLRHWTGFWHRAGESIHPLHTQMQKVFKSLDDFNSTGDPVNSKQWSTG